MQRGSNRLSVHRDEEMKAELRGLLVPGHPTRTAEWHDPEPAADDDPPVAAGPVTPRRSPGEVDALHYELARHLGRAPFPATPAELRAALRDRHAPDAPDALVERLTALPDRARYTGAHQLAEALVRARDRERGAAGAAGEAEE